MNQENDDEEEEEDSKIKRFGKAQEKAQDQDEVKDQGDHVKAEQQDSSKEPNAQDVDEASSGENKTAGKFYSLFIPKVIFP